MARDQPIAYRSVALALRSGSGRRGVATAWAGSVTASASLPISIASRKKKCLLVHLRHIHTLLDKCFAVATAVIATRL